MLERAAGYGGRAAIASGLLSLIALAFLVLFYVLEAPALLESESTDTWVPLGRTNDALVGLAALAALPLAARLHVSWRRSAPGPSAVAFTVAVVAMLATGATQLLYAVALIPTAGQTVLVGPLFAGFGFWLLAVNLGRADGALRQRLRWIGVAAGVGYALVAFTALLYAASGSSDPTAAFANPLLAAIAGLGLLGSQVGYPVWALWLGRRLGREG